MNESWWSKVKSARPELIALGLLIPLVLVLGFVLNRPPVKSPANSAGRPEATTGQVPLSSPTVSPSTSASPVQSPSVTSVQASPQQQTSSLNIQGPADTKHYDVPITDRVSVAQLLTLAQEQGLQLQTKDFGGALGLFIEAINGVKNDEAKRMYWTLYVNGKRSPLGASNTQVTLSDIVTWKFEKAHAE